MSGNNEKNLPDGRKGMQSPGKIENVKKSMTEQGRCFGMGEATLSGPVAVDKEREAAARNFSVKEGKKKDE